MPFDSAHRPSIGAELKMRLARVLPARRPEGTPVALNPSDVHTDDELMHRFTVAKRGDSTSTTLGLDQRLSGAAMRRGKWFG